MEAYIDIKQGSRAIAKSFSASARRFQHLLDKITPHVTARWLALVLIITIYAIRVYSLHGFYFVTYVLGIYNLNLLMGFLKPQVDPEMEGPTLPSKSDDEFRPFVRRLPEFKVWYACMKGFISGFCMTFLAIFDIPVFWPVLLVLWLYLLVTTLKQQVSHMYKYSYNPFSFGKKTYKGKAAVAMN